MLSRGAKAPRQGTDRATSTRHLRSRSTGPVAVIPPMHDVSLSDALSNEQRAQVVSCLVEGMSIRATVRVTGVATNTMRRFKRLTTGFSKKVENSGNDGHGNESSRQRTVVLARHTDVSAAP